MQNYEDIFHSAHFDGSTSTISRTSRSVALCKLNLSNKGTPASVTSTLSSEIFLRWISKKYLTCVTAFSRVGLCFQLINFRKFWVQFLHPDFFVFTHFLHIFRNSYSLIKQHKIFYTENSDFKYCNELFISMEK